MIFDQSVGDRKVRTFSLSQQFLDTFKDRQPAWGPVGYFVYMRTYSRELPDGSHEEWWQTCRRVIEGTFNIQKIHCRQQGLPWDEAKAQTSAQDMYRRMYEFKWSPPGRGLWVMGTDVVYERGASCLQNCAYHSTDHIGEDFSAPFTFLMDMSMLGVGVGLDTRGSGKIKLCVPKTTDVPFVVEDTREGWVALVKTILESFVGKAIFPLVIDYSKVRGRGVPLKTLGGIASGPRPLQDLVENLTRLLLPEGASATWSVVEDLSAGTISLSKVQILGSGEAYKIGSAKIVDIANYIGKAVVAGGVRRTAEIVFGEPEDEEFMTLKQDKEALQDRRWACVTGDTQIDTPDGSFPIKDLVGQENLHVVLNGETYAVEGAKKTKTDQVYEVRTFGGPILKATLDHLVMTDAGWVQVGALRVGDYLHASNNENTESTDFQSLDYKYGYLLGALIGDGTFTKTTTTGTDIARIMVYDQDPGVSSLCDYIQGIFTFPTRKDFSGFSGPHGKDGSKYYFISAKDFTRLAASWGVAKGNKTITERMETGSRNFIAGVASGLFDADGHVSKDRRCSIDSVDPKMLERLQRILLRLGVMSKQYKVREAQDRMFPGGCIRSCKPIYRLVMNSYKASKRFVDICGIHHQGKKEVWESLPATEHIPEHDFRFEVASVQPLGIEDVYDICVPSVHAFPANGLVVHNSNNSIFGRVGMDYSKVADAIAINGEPGILWLENTRAFSRMGHPADHKDWRVQGTNPCCEMGLESGENCNLVETYPAHHDTYEDFEKTLKMAYLYAKTVTLVPTHNQKTNAVMTRNRRIGCSMSGIVQAYAKHGHREFLNWCDKGYDYIQKIDRVYSDWLGIPLSIKTTTIKPSGSVSLLCGATPGIHYPHSQYYIRHIRVQNTSPLVQAAIDAGYKVEADTYADDTSVIAFPVEEKHYLKGKEDVTMWEQFLNAADLQHHWADNQISCTISFKKSEVPDIKQCLEVFEDKLKGISMLPLADGDHGYKHAPYVAINKEQYDEMVAQIKHPMSLTSSAHDKDSEDKFCTGDTCLLKIGK